MKVSEIEYRKKFRIANGHVYRKVKPTGCSSKIVNDNNIIFAVSETFELEWFQNDHWCEEVKEN